MVCVCRNIGQYIRVIFYSWTVLDNGLFKYTYVSLLHKRFILTSMLCDEIMNATLDDLCGIWLLESKVACR